MKDKKGVLGFDTVKAVLFGLLIIGVIVIAMILALSTLRDTAESTDTKLSGTVANKTLTSVSNSSFQTIAGDRNCVFSVTFVTNATSGKVLTATNYTIDGCRIVATGTSVFRDTNWNVSGTYTYNDNVPNMITQNISNGSVNFFKQIPTIFTLLGVVVLILVIAIVIVAVSRFGGGGREMGFGGGFGGRATPSDEL